MRHGYGRWWADPALGALAVALAAAPAAAREPAQDVKAGLTATPKAAADKPADAKPAEDAGDPRFAALTWRNIGPNRGGRSISAAGSTARPNEYYFAAVGGGLWKTRDGGTSWSNVTDGKIPTGSVGGVAVCEANPDIVYLTTGETQLRGNILTGNGVYKSVDAGKSWTHAGLAAVQNFSRVRIHPKDCDTVFVGGFGRYGAENADRGVYKSSDGGKSWRRTLYRDPRSGAVDISIDPANPRIMFAALWEAWRKPWGMSSGGPGSGLFRSEDGGESWTEITRAPGLPQSGPVGKIGVSVSPADGRRVYAMVEHQQGGVFVSDDGGQNWTRTNESRDLRQRAFYYTRIVADPKVRDRVYVLNVQFHRSDDGGKTFAKKIKVPHGDNHDLWIAADDNQRMIQANDGGANVSVNGGDSWTAQTYPTAQIYRLGLTHHQPPFACGGQQDNSTICVPVRGWRHRDVLGGYGFAAGGGESGYVANDPRNPDIFYAGSYGGTLDRFDARTGQSRAINVWPDNPMGYSAGDLKERFQWTFPIVFDPQDPKTLYVTSQHVWRSTDEGQSWQKISPDLTRADPATLGPSGGPITRDQTGVETYATVFALAPSRREADAIWAASDDGLVHVTRDNGGSWQNITPPGLPSFIKFTTIEDSPHRPGTAYLTGHRVLLDDPAPYVLKTSDYGRSWTRIDAGLPADEPARSIREDPLRPGLLFLGTERGVWVSFNDGKSWDKLQRNLPAVQVSDLGVAGDDLVIATHGRSFWVMERINVLRQLGVKEGAARLFAPATALRGLDSGAAIDYFLPATPASLKIEIHDMDGRLVRSLDGVKPDAKPKGGEAGDDDEDDGPKGPPPPTMKPGLNRFSWDMRHPGFVDFPDMILWTSRNRGGPLALPGRYRVTLTVDGRAQSQMLEIGVDPRVTDATPDALRDRFALAMQVRDRVSQANEAVLLIRGVTDQARARAAEARDPALKAALDGLVAGLRAVEGRIYQVRNESRQDPLNFPIMLNDKLAGLLGVIESAEARPTDQTRRAFAELSGQLDRELAAMAALLDTDLGRVNAALSGAGLAPITRTPQAPKPAA
jgi:photosystem II stability/assembly factor-like uncharacterized protein